MRQLTFFFLLLIISAGSNSYSQNEDSLFILSDSVSTEILYLDNITSQPIGFMLDCAHGHICCQAGCSCCPELSRKQVLKKKKQIKTNGITRYIVRERYYLAGNHMKSPIKYVFENEKDEIVNVFYSTVKPLMEYGERPFEWNFSMDNDDFKFGYAFVYDDECNHVLINESGKIIPMKYHSKEEVSKDVFKVSVLVNDLEIYGLVDQNGQELSKLKYHEIGTFTENGLSIATSSEGQFQSELCVINLQGEEIIKNGYRWITRVSDDLFSVMNDQGARLVDRTGKLVSQEYFGSIGELSEGRISVRQGKKMGFIDVNGKKQIKYNYDYCDSFHSGRAMVIINRMHGFIDLNGKLIVPLSYNNATRFENGRATIGVGYQSYTDKWSIIDTNGNVVTSSTYDELGWFKNGICKASVRLEGEWFLNSDGKRISSKGTRVITNESIDSYFPFDCAVIANLSEDKEFVIINQKGKKISVIPSFEYVRFPMIYSKNNALVPYLDVWSNMIHGLLDLKGQELLPQVYNQFRFLTEHTLIAVKGEEIYFVDLKTNEKHLIAKGQLGAIFPSGIVKIQGADNSLTYYTTDGGIIEGVKPLN